MTFEQLLKESYQELEEAAKQALSGTFDAFGQRINYRAESTGSGNLITAQTRAGKIGYIELNDGERKAYFFNPRDELVKIENFSKRLTKRVIENDLVPELVNRLLTRDMFESEEHVEEVINEIAAVGNIGIMELVQFEDKASRAQKALFDRFLKAKQYKDAWKLVQNVIGVSLIGAEFN